MSHNGLKLVPIDSFNDGRDQMVGPEKDHPFIGLHSRDARFMDFLKALCDHESDMLDLLN